MKYIGTDSNAWREQRPGDVIGTDFIVRPIPANPGGFMHLAQRPGRNLVLGVHIDGGVADHLTPWPLWPRTILSSSQLILAR
jgi:hypothetical protein